MATCAVTGTVGDGATEAEIVTGSGTIILTLTDDTWIAGAPTETYEMFYNCDYPSQTTYAYGPHGVGSITGTLAGTGAAVNTPASYSIADSPDGGNVFAAPSGADFDARISFPITSSHFTSSVGYISLYYYKTTINAFSCIAEFYAGETSELGIKQEADGTVSVRFKGSNANVAAPVSTATIPAATWTQIQVRWSVPLDTVGVKVGTAAWVDSTSNSISTFTTEPTSLSINNTGDGNVPRPVFWDAIKIWKTYDAT